MIEYKPNLWRANNDELTANDNSMGSSGGTTDVKINVHSKKSLYRFLFGFSVPRKRRVCAQYKAKLYGMHAKYDETKI